MDGHEFCATVESFALSLPEAWPDNPWGDRVVKVGKKIFLFVSGPDSDRPVITVKVPESRDHALSYPEAFPTRYGLGKHGWVTLFVDTVPEEEREVLLDFAEESYRAVATKTLVKRLDAKIAATDPSDADETSPPAHHDALYGRCRAPRRPSPAAGALLRSAIPRSGRPRGDV